MDPGRQLAAWVWRLGATCGGWVWRVSGRASCAAGRVREYSSAPPESGRGFVRTNNQAFCSAPCIANIRITMIVLLSAWNSHE